MFWLAFPQFRVAQQNGNCHVALGPKSQKNEPFRVQEASNILHGTCVQLEGTPVRKVVQFKTMDEYQQASMKNGKRIVREVQYATGHRPGELKEEGSSIVNSKHRSSLSCPLRGAVAKPSIVRSLLPCTGDMSRCGPSLAVFAMQPLGVVPAAVPIASPTGTRTE